MSTQPKRSSGTWLAIAFCVVVVATVAASIATMGTPWQQRNRRLDDARIDDLIRIRNAIHCYAKKHGQLPRDIAAAVCEDRDARVADLETHRPYEYLPGDKDHYRLCAVFETDSRNAPDDFGTTQSRAWRHPAGRYCFQLSDKSNADPAGSAAMLKLSP